MIRRFFEGLGLAVACLNENVLQKFARLIAENIPPQGLIVTHTDYGISGMGHAKHKYICPYCAQQKSAMRWNNVGNGMHGSSTGESSSGIKSCISCLGYLVGGFIISVILIILF